MQQDWSTVGRRQTALAARWGWRYLRRFVIDPAFRPFSLGRRVWRLGRAERVVLLLFASLAILSTVATGHLLPARLDSGAAGFAQLGWFVLAWSVGFAAVAAQRGPSALVVAGPWLIWYQILACGDLVGTPVAVLPVVWFGWITFAHVRALTTWRARIAWWLPVSAGLGYVTAGPSGLRRVLGWYPFDAQAMVAVVLVALGLLACRLLPRRAEAARPGFGVPLIGALLTVGSTIGFAAARDWNFTVGWVQEVFTDAAAIVVLFWLCIAGQFAADLLTFMAWIIRRVLRVLPFRALHARWLLQTITWGALLWLVPRALMATARKVVESRASPGALASAGLFAVVVGLAIECGKLNRDWRHATGERIRAQIAFIALVLACAIALSSNPGNTWETTRLLMILVGMLHLGVPLAVHEHAHHFGNEPDKLDLFGRFGTFAAGYMVAIAVLAIEPRSAIALIGGAPILLAVLWMLRRHAPRAGRWNGAVGGALFGGGIVAGWMMPYPPTLPFVPEQALTRVLRDWGALGRPPLSAQHFALLATAWVVCGTAGWFVFRHPRRNSEAPS